MSPFSASRAFALLVCLAAATTAGAATFTVTNNAASGPGSLQDAVMLANSTPGADTVAFAIGSGPVTIDNTSVDIQGPVTIDGTTQPGYAGVPLVRLRGGSGNTTIIINAGPATIRALQIDGSRRAIDIRSDHNRVAGCYIGTDGTSSLYQGGSDQFTGINVQGSNNVIGGTTVADRNVIAGCSIPVNVSFGASNNTIAGNHIGVNAAGTAVIVRPFATGITLLGGDGNVVGGSDPGARNLICGDQSAAVNAAGTNLRVEGNYLGVDITGLRALPNGWGVAAGDAPGAIIRNNTIATNRADGVRVGSKNMVVQGNRIGVGIDGVTPLGVFLGVGIFPGGGRNFPEHDGNIIGGTGPGEANVIAYATWYGVGVSSRSTGNRISGNSIHHNASLGIDLQTGLPQDFVTPNDSGDTDNAANKLQNFPVLTALSQSGGSVFVDGTLNSAPSQTYTIEVFTSDACHERGHGEGQTYLGSATVTTDASNLGTFRVTLPPGSPMPRVLTATATDADGNTSEFSRCFAPAGFVRFVTTTGNVTEGGSVTLAIARSGALDAPLTARYTTSERTATSGADFVAADGTVTFPAGVPEVTFTIDTIDDSVAEPGETFVVSITGETFGSGAEQPAEANVTISDAGDAAVPNLLVTNTNDSGPGSLRQAILDSEAHAGPDVIGFAIGSGQQSIQIVSDLPEIHDVVVIDATTQPGFSGRPIVELRGPESGFALTGFRLMNGAAVIRGFVINRLSNFVMIRDGNGHVIAGNWFGLNLDGNTAASPPSAGTFPTLLHNNGVSVIDGVGARIGGTAAADRNVFVSVGNGIFTETSPVGTVIQGNSFGLNAAGDAVVGINTPIIANSGVLFGGTEPGAGNIAAGMTFGLVFGGSGTVIQGNLIGTDGAGTSLGPSLSPAIRVFGRNMTIGGAIPAARNVISGSRWGGIALESGAQNNTVQGNFLGTDATGMRVVSDSGPGVLLQHFFNDPATNDNRIIGNVIGGSGNAIDIWQNVQRTTILGNRIGVGADGETPLTTTGGGIAIASGSFDNVIGDVTPGAGNIIANRTFAVSARNTRTTVRGNSIYANSGGIQSANFPPPGPLSAQSAGGRTTISGTFSTSGAAEARNVQIDFYANPECSGRPEGKTYLGTFHAPVAAFQSNGSFNAVLPVRAAGGITATVTDPAAKSTTDFSPCTVIYTPGEARFSAAEYDASERDSSVTLTIERHGGATGSGSVRFSLIDGTARAGSDYLPATNEVVSFGDGETSKTITIRIVRDNVGEGGEEFYVQLHPSMNLAIGEPSRATVRVSEELPSINVFDARFDEGNDGPRTIRIPVRLSIPTTSAVTVRYRLVAGTAADGEDFLDGGGTVTFAPGETRASIPVTVIGDAVPEPLETFSVVLHSPTRGVIERGIAEIGITNDDPHFTAFRDLVYSESNGRALALDLYVPVGEGPFPLVVWIHGEDWATGSKTFTPALRLAERGYAVASIDYRLSGESVFPAQLHDAREALRWLRAHAAAYRLAPNQVAVWGSGAGGHLAALLGTTADDDVAGDPAGDPNAIRVQAVVTWYAPTDLVALAASAPCDAPRDPFTAPERALLGCVVESCPATARAASPLTYVSRGDARALVMHGAMDCVVPAAQSEAFARALQAAEVGVTLVILPNAMHGGSEWGSAQALAEVDAFLDRTLRPPSMTVP